MVINTDEAKLLGTIAQLQEFLDATQEIRFTDAPGDREHQRYEHISRVLKRFSCPGLGKGERGVVAVISSTHQRRLQPLAITRLVGRRESNRMAAVPLDVPAPWICSPETLLGSCVCQQLGSIHLDSPLVECPQRWLAGLDGQRDVKTVSEVSRAHAEELQRDLECAFRLEA